MFWFAHETQSLQFKLHTQRRNKLATLPLSFLFIPGLLKFASFGLGPLSVLTKYAQAGCTDPLSFAVTSPNCLQVSSDLSPTDIQHVYRRYANLEPSLP